MKRWLSHFTIVAYLTALSWGIVAHALNFGATSHPGMYFLVWDMFCGWSAYSDRMEVIGEGESGTYYQLAPGPWGEFTPYGDLGRRHYDYYGNLSYQFAMNTLKHTAHEPMARIIVIEKAWAKKFNLPDHLYEQRFGKPKDKLVYHKVRYVFTPDGVMLSSAPGWLSEQFALAVADNPRLQADTQRERPMFAFGLNNRSRSVHQSADPYDPYRMIPAGTRSGN